MYPDLRGCATKPLSTLYQQRGNFWVIENYIPALLSFDCDASVTYTTHSEYSYLHNLDVVASRWQGPISIAVYASGTDFDEAVRAILYLRTCRSKNIEKYVSFHLFFNISHTPRKIPTFEELMKRDINCNDKPPLWSNTKTYRHQKNLSYPINVARNIARLASQTYFVLPCDVELIPSVNVIPEFFEMLRRPDVSTTTKPRVYVLPVFEVKENLEVPRAKKELQRMLQRGDAIVFHENICPECHTIPNYEEWRQLPALGNLSVFHIGKRTFSHYAWEPIYIGTNQEPLYDERLSWEGQRDKMTQMYILCVRDYEFHILDNAFLVHRPGIKSTEPSGEQKSLILEQYRFIRDIIIPQYKSIFGSSIFCGV
ncbi:hypothetical protein SK128_025292 [Halocaridina rubra]|uniref:N-acetyllactosaminide beta-1,3-N-acetylglucosaminyltransferase n=1 Tax=Halocaridina rubra TaxID=373956 RepID=A0AAN8WVC6_HALRR